MHRDLKPSNILLHEDVWKVADFGIAKFVADANSLNTLREYQTPAYAAPEQWRNERPTSATDVYALGCVITSLVTGHPPFGDDGDELRDKHLHAVPDRLERLPARISAFVSHMLRKEPSARPTTTTLHFSNSKTWTFCSRKPRKRSGIFRAILSSPAGLLGWQGTLPPPSFTLAKAISSVIQIQ